MTAKMRQFISQAGLESLSQYDVKVYPVGDVSMEGFQEQFDSLVKGLNVGYFGRLGLESQQMEEDAKDNGNMNVYVVNPRQSGFAATAAMTADALRNPDNTVVTVVENPDQPFSEEEKGEIAEVKGLFEALGAKVFDDMEKMSGYVNAEVSGDEPDAEPPKDDNDDLDKGDESTDGDDETPPDSVDDGDQEEEEEEDTSGSDDDDDKGQEEEEEGGEEEEEDDSDKGKDDNAEEEEEEDAGADDDQQEEEEEEEEEK